MWPVKPTMKSSNMWSVEQAMLQSSYKKRNQVKQESVCNDKNCQSTKSIHMWALKSAMKSSYMQSVSRSSHMWPVQPAVTQSTYKKFNQASLCNDKSCQYTKKHSYEECDGKNCQCTKSVCNNKNCQSTKCACMLKLAMPHSSYKKWSRSGVTQSYLSRNARKQIGTHLK